MEVNVDSLEAAAPIASELASSPLTPTAIELSWAPARLLVRFESVEASVAQQAEAARAIVGTRGDAVVRSGGDEEETWRRHAAHWSSGGTLVKLSTVPAELFPTLVRVRDRAATDGLEMAVAGRAGLGVVDVRLNGPLDAQARLVGDLRERLPIGRGSAVIRRGDPGLRRNVDAWGPIGDGMRVMTAIKRRFDPDGLLNTGRGPGGL